MVYKVLWHNMLQIKPGTLAFLRALHNTRDQRFYVPSGRNNITEVPVRMKYRKLERITVIHLKPLFSKNRNIFRFRNPPTGNCLLLIEIAIFLRCFAWPGLFFGGFFRDRFEWPDHADLRELQVLLSRRLWVIQWGFCPQVHEYQRCRE